MAIAWPQAERLSRYSTDDVGARKKVGRYIAVARSNEEFNDFYAAIVSAAGRVSSNPGRLLVFSHFVNSIAVALRPLNPATLPLVEGYVLEAVSRGDIARVIVLSSQLSPYQLLTAAVKPAALEQAVTDSLGLLNLEGYLTLSSTRKCLPRDLRDDAKNPAYLLSHLVYRGLANAIDGAATTVDRVTAIS